MRASSFRSAFSRGAKTSLASGKYVWGIVAIFFLAVAFLGGSSRHDHMQVVLLRPISILCLCFFCAHFAREQLENLRLLTLLLLLWAVWVFLQLIPLPPGIWQALPGRSAIQALDEQLLVGEIWRPISLSPTIGWSAFASLAIPAAALLMAVVLQLSSRFLLLLVAALGLGNVMFGFLQMAAGGAGALHIYRVSNRGGPTGLFANENHMGAFLAIVLLVFAKLTLDAIKSKQAQSVLLAFGFCIPITFLAILINGSRAGIALGLFASLTALVMFWVSAPPKARRSRSQSAGFAKLPMRTLAFAGAAGIFVLLFVLFLTLERIPGLEGAATQDPLADLRLKLVDPLKEMIGTYWILGVGFGAFSAAYLQFEPTEIAGPSYVNQAHNDWAQLLIEGGIPAAAIFCALLWLISSRIVVMARRGGAALPSALFWTAIFAILAAASVVDYPLRTAIFQVSAIWLICALLREENPDNAAQGSHDGSAWR